MNKRLRKSVLPTLLAFLLGIVIVPMAPAAAQNSSTTVYLDPPTITGATVGEEFTVNLNIRDASNVYSWQAGLTFNHSLLECLNFNEGEFLSGVGGTYWLPGTIDNAAGIITSHGSTLLGEITASGSGRLASLTFRVKAPGISDLHIRDAAVSDFELLMVPFYIIDVYTAVVDTTLHSVVTVSNSIGLEELYGSGFYDHAFSVPDKEISFKVTGPYAGFSNVTIPKTLLLPPELPYAWGVIIDGKPISITATENDTHTFVYFTYSEGIHSVLITTRFASSTISLTLSPTSITLGSNATISGTITPLRTNVEVAIQYRLQGGTWGNLTTEKTDASGSYAYTWTPQQVGTYDLKASWEGDITTLSAESEARTVTVKEKAGEAGIDLYLVIAAVIALILIVAIVIYFVKIRKPEKEE